MMHVILGLMNSGKTLFMTWKAYHDFKQGREIITNYHLGFPHKEINKDYIKMLGETQPDLYNKSFFLDEFWIWFDSRKSRDNVLATNFLLQSSKQDTNIYMTSQDNMQNDLRVRQNTHFYTTVKRCLLMPEGKLQQITEGQRILPENMQDKLYIEYMTYAMRMTGFSKEPYLKETGAIKGNKIFKLYDTHQKVKSE